MATLSVSRNGGPGVAPVPARRGAVRLGLAVSSGLVLALAFPPLDLEFLGWIGLVPLLRACRGLGPRAAFGTGWLGGAVFYLAIVYWVVHTISAYSAVPFALAVAILLLMVSVLACYMGAFAARPRARAARPDTSGSRWRRATSSRTTSGTRPTRTRPWRGTAS